MADVSVAAWSNDPMANLPISMAPGEQAQPKVAATADGGAYISWFDGGAGGWDVYLQRVSASGEVMWPAGGVLVADRSFSSTQDYGLSVDAAGHAILAFRDDRFGGVQITAARVAPDGTLDWGSNGVQLTTGSAFVAAPKIAGGSDGGIVVAWTNDNVARVTSLDSTGATVWTNTLTDAGGLGLSPSDMHASDAAGQTGEVILLVVQQGGFATPRHLMAQKFDSSGAALWGAAPVAIFTSGSLQFGNFPDFVTDGAGGGVFAWYTNSPLQAFVQRLDATGAAALPVGGMTVSTNTSRVRVNPSVAFDQPTQSIYTFWVEENSNQSQFGLYGQRINSGVRQWGPEGAAVVALQSDQISQVRAIALDSDGVAFYTHTTSFNNQQILGVRLNISTSATVWTNDVSTVASGVSRTAVAVSGNQAILAWSDTRNDGNDIYAQNVNADGSLGVSAVLGDLNGDGVVNGADLATLLTQWGCAFPANCPADFDNSGVVDGFDLATLLTNWTG